MADITEFAKDIGFVGSQSDFDFFPELLRGGAALGGLVLASDIPYLSPVVRAQLAGGLPTFRLRRFFSDILGQGELR